MYSEIYYKQMQNWAFTKNGGEYPQYSIHGLRYRSEYTLKQVSQMKIGDTIVVNGSQIKRIKDRE